MKEWTKIFKGLANENRLKILHILAKTGELPVHEISKKIGLGVKPTSKHLIILSNLSFLQNEGKRGSVWYRISPELRREVRYIITRFLPR